jgi:transposase
MVVKFALSPGRSGDGLQGREWLLRLGAPDHPAHLLMDRAYEGNETRQLALDLGCIPVVSPLRTRIEPWDCDRPLCKRRNEVERVFRRAFSRFDRLDAMFTAFVLFALIVEVFKKC